MYPHERSLVQRLANQPFALIGVNSDPLENARAALERESITWRSFFNGGTTGGPISRAWGVTGWPTIYVLDDRGVIRFRNVRGEDMDKAVDELIEWAVVTLVENIKSEDPGIRGLAAFRMGRSNAPDAIAAIAGLVEDADATVQQRTATGLALLGQPAAPLLPKIRAAAADADTDVRVASLEVLSAAKDAESVPLAVKALEDEQIPVRVAAVKALGLLGDPSTAPALAQAVDDEATIIAREAAYALADMQAPQSAELLKELAAKSDHPARVWIAVARHRVDPTDTDARLKSLMADQDVEIRRQAASVLPELRGFDPIEIFIAALEDADDQVSKASRQYLAKSDSPRAQEALQQYLVARIEKLLPTLSERDMNVRRKAQTELLGLGPEVAPLLMDRLLPMEDALAMTALGQVIGATRNSVVLPGVMAQIENAELADERRLVFENVLRYFPEAMSKKAVELAKSGEPPLRLSGVRLLASVGDGAAGEVLKEALKDTDQRVRAFAAYGLARARDPDALEVLKELAVQDDRAIQQQAIVGLSNYDEESALPTIQKLLASEDQQVRNIAFSLLGRYKSPQVTALIVETAAADEALGRQAMSVLSQQNTADAARALGEYLKNADADIQRQAQALLQRMRVPEARDILQEFRKQQEESQKAKSEAEKEKADG